MSSRIQLAKYLHPTLHFSGVSVNIMTLLQICERVPAQGILDLYLILLLDNIFKDMLNTFNGKKTASVWDYYV